MRGRLTRKSSIVVLALAGVLAAVGVGWAAIPAADGTISACYATANGPLLGPTHSKGDTRIVDSGEPCRSYEKAIAWNQKGPKGDTGAPGAAGKNGLDGKPGADGKNGLDGMPGADGKPGVNGVDGKDGLDGKPGPPGPAGTGSTLFLGRGLLGGPNCQGSCTIFSVRPDGFTDGDQLAEDEKTYRAPSGGLKVSDFSASLNRAPDAGRSMYLYLVETGTSNVFTTCEIDAPSTSCTAPDVTIPGGTQFVIRINTSYRVSGARLDFSWRGA